MAAWALSGPAPNQGFIQSVSLSVIIESFLRISQFFLDAADLAVTERDQPNCFCVRWIGGRQTLESFEDAPVDTSGIKITRPPFAWSFDANGSLG